jgi:hypothetical protein
MLVQADGATLVTAPPAPGAAAAAIAAAASSDALAPVDKPLAGRAAPAAGFGPK